MFQLTKEEWANLRLQIETSRWGGSRYQPFAFTEQGLAMLSGLLNSDVAIEVNISIMRAFVALRQLVLNSPTDEINILQQEIRELKQYVEDVFTDYNDINEDTRMQLELINETLAELQTKPRRRIGYV
jgi:ORF6N domain.